MSKVEGSSSPGERDSCNLDQQDPKKLLAYVIIGLSLLSIILAFVCLGVGQLSEKRVLRDHKALEELGFNVEPAPRESSNFKISFYGSGGGNFVVTLVQLTWCF